MHLRRVRAGGQIMLQVRDRAEWTTFAPVASGRTSAAITPPSAADLVAFLAAPADARRAIVHAATTNGAGSARIDAVLLPFAPRSFRDFMLYERHARDAARGFVRAFHPRLRPLIAGYEALTRTTFPALRPSRLWYREPIYYMGNHLAFITDGHVVIPSYTAALDYELEIGCVLARGLLNASPQQAEAAIGGFVVVNDFSARDVQLREMRSGFGPQKSKHFCNGMSAVVATADEVLPRCNSLRGFVRINGELVAEPAAAGARWSFGELLAHASRCERLYPGELFASGTLPGGSGIETGRLLAPGDLIEIGIDHIGSLTHRVVAQQDEGHEDHRPI